MRALDELRRQILLPSDCLALARNRNPNVEIDLVDVVSSTTNPGGSRVIGSKFQLQIKTGRGTLKYDKGAGERWVDVFRRADLLP